jgi:hypothetical protein
MFTDASVLSAVRARARASWGITSEVPTFGTAYRRRLRMVASARKPPPRRTAAMAERVTHDHGGRLWEAPMGWAFTVVPCPPGQRRQLFGEVIDEGLSHVSRRRPSAGARSAVGAAPCSSSVSRPTGRRTYPSSAHWLAVR